VKKFQAMQKLKNN